MINKNKFKITELIIQFGTRNYRFWFSKPKNLRTGIEPGSIRFGSSKPCGTVRFRFWPRFDSNLTVVTCIQKAFFFMIRCFFFPFEIGWRVGRWWTDGGMGRATVRERYEKLGLAEALSRAHDYPSACHELGLILRLAYADLPKNLQSVVFQDTLSAFRLLPEWESVI